MDFQEAMQEIKRLQEAQALLNYALNFLASGEDVDGHPFVFQGEQISNEAISAVLETVGRLSNEITQQVKAYSEAEVSSSSTSTPGQDSPAPE